MRFACDVDRLFYTSESLDFTVVALKPQSIDSGQTLDAYGHLPLLDVPGKAMEGEWLTIVQHPRGEPKQLCVRENQLIKRDGDVLWYSSDTLPGSSGSPVFDNDWYVVALHHSGVPEKKDGRIQTLRGTDFDERHDREDDIKWIANEGIRASRIVQALKAALPQHPLLRPLFEATPQSARAVINRLADPVNPASPAAPVSPRPPEIAPMSQTVTVPITLTCDIDSNGQIRISGAGHAGPAEAAFEATPSTGSSSAAPTAKRDAPFDGDYTATGRRKGYDADFLAKAAQGLTTEQKNSAHVALPQISNGLLTDVVHLIDAHGQPTADFVLNYFGFSLAMKASRKLAYYSAANVRYDQRFNMGRPSDNWRIDPRIPPEFQIGGRYYERNNFDRGHLTRREDMEYGPSATDALEWAADTCHFTNCTPQHSKFNQNKEIWQGIERHVLEDSIWAKRFGAHIFTGPVFDPEDPVYKGERYPLQFWKVVAALNASGKLFATAFIASQQDVIARYGIEADEIPFTPYKNFQVKIAHIEQLTGLRFTSGRTSPQPLSLCDPLEKVTTRRRRVKLSESSMADVPDAYLPISDLDDIIL